jgi:hypothetical protein
MQNADSTLQVYNMTTVCTLWTERVLLIEPGIALAAFRVHALCMQYADSEHSEYVP